MALLTPASGQFMTWDEVMSAISEKRRALEDEEKAVQEQLKTVEEQARIQDEHVELLKARLATLKGKVDPEPPLTIKPEDAVAAAPAGLTRDFQQKENELIELGASRMLVMEGGEGAASGAFPALHDGRLLIFVSAQWLDKNPRPKVTKSDKSALAIGDELACPAGVDLVCLRPDATDLPHFELADVSEKPAVGARIVVIFLDPKTRRAKGVGGSIRGIGPDTLELDAELMPQMTGAPVLSLDSGKVIGIVAPQIAGVQDEWAIGTRHQGSRNFATRIDRIKEWKTGDLGRFANEAAYIESIKLRTRIAWLAHMLVADKLNTMEYLSRDQSDRVSWIPGPRRAGESVVDFEARLKREKEDHYRKVEEQRRERLKMDEFFRTVRMEAKKHAANPHIARVTSWLNEPLDANTQSGGGVGGVRLSNIYRSILADLSKQEPDLTAHMTPYHQQQYRIARESRGEGIRIMAGNANRVGQ